MPQDEGVSFVPILLVLAVFRPPLLLVVGMHRSGTSLLGSLLPACGIATPGPLIAGDTHNPEGYFERADITALQEQLLIDLERWWPAPEGCKPLASGWMQGDVSQHALEQLTALLAHDCASQSGPWAIKDPRSSLLLPLWKQACLTLKIPLQLLLAVRDPAEVMVSLVRRDQAVTGMDGWRAQRLWWHHNAQVLRDGADLPLQVVSYSHWFNPGTALQQLYNLAPEASEEQRRQALDCVKPQHRRSHGRKAQADDHHTPQQLLTRGTPVLKRQPVANEPDRNTEDDRGFVGVMGFVLDKHRPHIRQAEVLQLAIPLPGAVAKERVS